MKPQDINAIASAVVANLTGSDAQLMGCGAISSAQDFDANVYACTGQYECGGEGDFRCVEVFDCANDFYCDCGFDWKGCGNSREDFDCMDQFGPV